MTGALADEGVRQVVVLAVLVVLAGSLALILARRTAARSAGKSPLALLRQAAEAVGAQRERRDVIQQLLGHAVKLSRAELAAVALSGDDDSTADLYTWYNDELRIDTTNVAGRFRALQDGDNQRQKGNNRWAYTPSHNLPSYYPPLKNVIGAPLCGQGQVIGEMFLANKPGNFSAEDENLVALMASQASPLLENQMLLAQLKRGYMETIQALVMAVEAKDAYTRGHSERVIRYAVAIAKEMGLPTEQVEDIRVGAVLHDIGKIGVSEAIINKPGKLTDEEWRAMRDHPKLATKIIDSFNRSRDILLMVYHHHESYDGRGYPTGIKGTEIPLSARILKVADSFEAMTSKRPYQRTKTFEEALSELKNCAGTQFDPLVVVAFQRAFAEGKQEMDEVGPNR